MDNSILVGKHIRNILVGDGTLSQYLQTGQITALVANENTTFPFIVFSRTGLTPSYTKDGLLESNITFEIVCVSTDYVESLEIANIVRNLLECKCYTDDGIYIKQIILSAVNEDYLYDAYVQRLTFSMVVQ
jgi:hypothetical protein